MQLGAPLPPPPLGVAMNGALNPGDYDEQLQSASPRLQGLKQGLSRWQMSSSGAEEAALLAAQLLWSRQVSCSELWKHLDEREATHRPDQFPFPAIDGAMLIVGCIVIVVRCQSAYTAEFQS